MKHGNTILAAVVVGSLAAWGCGGDEDDAGSAGTTGSAGAAGSAGTSGAAGSAGTAVSPFWGEAYDPPATPSSGMHRAGEDCMTCHANARKLLFGGTVYQADGTTPAVSVEVGIRDSDGLHTAYSAKNGNFWVEAGVASIDWTNAEVRLRNASGETIKTATASAGCNGCHTGGVALTEP